MAKSKYRLFDWMDASYTDYDTPQEARKDFDERVKEAEEEGVECDVALYKVLACYNNVDAKMNSSEVVKFNC